MRVTERGLAAALAAGLVLAGLPAGAGAEPDRGPVPYDGSNPFNCKLQEVGTGTVFPEPHADPFCVEYDKTNQNVSQLGVVQFAMQEPARFAVAGNKCFYFQHDHWTGSIVQGQAPELWHWDGSYYWDRARGTGATYFENMRIGGYGDWAPVLPLLPPDMRRYAHPTGWGAVVYSRYPVDKRCAAMVDTPEKAARVYRQPARPKPAPAARCASARGRLRGRRL